MAGIIIIDQERCKGCDLCIEVCPHKLIEKARSLNSKGQEPVTYEEGASCLGKGCMLCYLVCPDVAIEILKEDEESQAKSDKGGKE